jgi:hypothetical protein
MKRPRLRLEAVPDSSARSVTPKRSRPTIPSASHAGLYRWVLIRKTTIVMSTPARPRTAPMMLNRYCTRQRSGGAGGSGGGWPLLAANWTCLVYRACCLRLTKKYQPVLGATITTTIPTKRRASQTRSPSAIGCNLIAAPVDSSHDPHTKGDLLCSHSDAGWQPAGPNRFAGSSPGGIRSDNQYTRVAGTVQL